MHMRNQEATLVGKFNALLQANFKGMSEAKSPFRTAYNVRDLAYLRQTNECLKDMTSFLDEVNVDQMKKNYKQSTSSECFADFRR